VQRKLNSIGVYGTVGLEFGLSVLIGLFGGQWLDRRFHTDPWLTFLGMAFGTAAGMRTLWRTARKARDEIDDEDRRQQEARRKYHDRNRSQ
jgi:ATP synthase protein I